jgi:hypothetical protein
MISLRDSRRLLVLSFLFLQSCSSGPHRKFEEGDLGKEMSVDIAKKFEIKDLPSGSPTPSPSPAPEEKGKKKKKKAEVKAASEPLKLIPKRRPSTLPFPVGERLRYDIRYLGVTAAHMEVEVMPEKSISERPVIPLRSKIKTVPVFELVYRVDDTVFSYFDSEGMFSHRFTMDLDESKQSRKLIELYDYDKNQSFFWNRIDHSEKGLIEQKESYAIRPWSQDPLSAIYFMRVADLPLEPGREYRYPVILDGKPWETLLRYVGKDRIYAGGKEREALVYQVENYHKGELRNRENKIWFSNDERRLVLRIETKMKIGSFAVALDQIL